MHIIIVSIVSSVATIVYSFMKQRKLKKELDELLIQGKFEKFDQNKKLLFSVLVLLIITAFISYFAFKENPNTGWALLIFLGSALVTEPIINKNANIFYYNDTSCILDSKIITFRSIKEIKQVGLPLMKQREILTLSNEKFKVDNLVADLIESKMSQRIKNKK